MKAGSSPASTSPAAGKVVIETANAVSGRDPAEKLPGFVPGEYAMLIVCDNGCGMDPETQTRVFEPFFTTRGIGEGVGMGLATVYGIVKQNNGFIYVDSEPGEGTLFRLYFPRQEAASSGEADAGRVPVPTEWETVLLVEDDPSVLEMCQLMLKKLGHPVLTAVTPADALRLAEEYGGDIHLLVSDVIMPAMNGAELFRRIARLRPDIKCLFMSGYTADIIARQGVLGEGMNFIEKPFTRKELDARIRGIFRNE